MHALAEARLAQAMAENSNETDAKEQTTYVAACPAGGHDARWHSTRMAYTQRAGDAPPRLVIDCAVCP